MSWESWSDFWAMGGDGLYVWSAYLISIVLIALEVGVLVLTRLSIHEHLGRFSRIVGSDTKPRSRS
jgi:heme exporter protein D